jgi:tryptophan synthase alpha chain
MSGLKHISDAFRTSRSEGRAALMPYYTLGFPNAEDSLAVIASIARSGADLIELGIPFSDPLADGPTIQRSTQAALADGMTLPRCLDMAARLRLDGISQPLLLMGYINPILSYGAGRFVADAARAGADGLIVPDLPPEEAGELEDCCREYGLALVFLAAPTSTPERLALIAAHTTGFLYLVSVTGVTGARSEVSSGLEDFARRVHAATDLPLAVGFGISTSEQARQVSRFSEGVIVGSALIEAVAKSSRPAEAASEFIESLRKAILC